MNQIKYVDVLGNEIKTGDFVLNATHCTSTAHLRRSLIKSIDRQPPRYAGGSESIVLKMKSIIPKPNYTKFVWDGKTYETVSKPTVICGNSRQIKYPNNKTKQFNDIIVFDVVRFSGNIDRLFNEEELNLITKSKVKITI